MVDTSPFEEFIAENEDSIKRCEANERVLIADAEKIEQGEAQKLRDEIKSLQNDQSFGPSDEEDDSEDEESDGESSSSSSSSGVKKERKAKKAKKKPMSLRDQLSAISADQEKLSTDLFKCKKRHLQAKKLLQTHANKVSLATGCRERQRESKRVR